MHICEWCGEPSNEVYATNHGEICSSCLVNGDVYDNCEILNVNCVMEFLDENRAKLEKFARAWYKENGLRLQ